jgi:hypothetical protein
MLCLNDIHRREHLNGTNLFEILYLVNGQWPMCRCRWTYDRLFRSSL